ncbi:hypothetical protein [Kribbella sp. C-35]|uniref:hypothetical protein n=1 Tax=Kribbella sp. C-35 TaxID=2789276 RepID=UPI00397BCA14
MDRIEVDALYDERGDVSRARPLLQGDVFDGVVLPGFTEEPMLVQIVAHPCAMRTGASLTPRITVAPVEPHQKIKGTGWNSNVRLMPLAELTNNGHFAAKFVDVTACPAGLLTRDRRIATLSHQGIYVLQQRLIKHYTRTEMGLEILRSQSAPVLTEAELLWDWLECVLTESETAEDKMLDAETAVFETWMRDGDPSPQQRLRFEIHHTDVRREAQRAAAARAKTRRAQG